MRKRKASISIGNKIFNVLNITLFIILGFLCLYPFYYVIIYSISNPAQANNVILLPKGFSLETYKALFRTNDIFNAFWISTARTVLGTCITIICTSFLAYLVTQKAMYFRKLVYRFVIITMYLNAGIIPWYLTMKSYGLKDNFLLYIIPSAISAYYMILIKTYIESLPPALEESAMIDGAGYITIFARIIFPLAKPIIATVAIYAAVGQWNTWSDNFFLVNDAKLQTLQMILYNYLQSAQTLSNATTQDILSGGTVVKITPMAIKMCITVIATAPILFVYPFLQKYFVKGIMIGAVKG